MKNTVTQVKVRERWICDTNGNMHITALINGNPASFCMSPACGNNWKFLGVDCCDVMIPDSSCYGGYRTVDIGKPGTGGHKYYALHISSGVLTERPKENQKDFWMTGQYYSTKGVPAAFKKCLQSMIENDEVTDSFKREFGL